ncbi:hypothetical protein FIBSPDRAFT_886618 [Athelia psychrophila]|uniref:Uncharacterized protein n=1 Tax=Athelia psychrophila TaxID=1759441 RepID=A0A166QP64_9AGAM|nr:hypothetical protein FIBSPDRAFT_886618 [Fibularhizoctonia sp. CBS 109695]
MFKIVWWHQDHTCGGDRDNDRTDLEGGGDGADERMKKCNVAKRTLLKSVLQSPGCSKDWDSSHRDQTEGTVIISVYLNTTSPQYDISWILIPKDIECGLVEFALEIHHLTVDGDAADATVLATWYMFRSAEQWDVYIGSGYKLINRVDMIYADTVICSAEIAVGGDEISE